MWHGWLLIPRFSLTDYSDHFVVGGLKFQACAVDSNGPPRPFRSLGVGLVCETRRICIADNKDKEGRSSPRAAICQVCGTVTEKRNDIGAALAQIATSNDQSVF